MNQFNIIKIYRIFKISRIQIIFKFPINCKLEDTGVANERSYPTSESSGGREETPCVLHQGPVTLRSHSEPEARGGSWEEPDPPEVRAGGWEEQPKEWWLHRHRRA